MRKLTRLPLTEQARRFLRDERTKKVCDKSDHEARVAEARRLWSVSFRDNRAFREIGKTLRAMASGLDRCMYCEDSQGTDIEHFEPRSRNPERAFAWDNYLWACSHCNSNEKRAQFPVDEQGQPLLINPTVDDPAEHLHFLPKTGQFTGATTRGTTSVEVFGLKREILRKGRHNWWLILTKTIIPRYAQFHRRGDTKSCDQILDAIREGPFSVVLQRLLLIAERDNASDFIGDDDECLSALRTHKDTFRQLLGARES